MALAGVAGGGAGTGLAAGGDGASLGPVVPVGWLEACEGTAASFCGATGLTAVAAPAGLGLAVAASFCFSSDVNAW